MLEEEEEAERNWGRRKKWSKEMSSAMFIHNSPWGMGYVRRNKSGEKEGVGTGKGGLEDNKEAPSSSLSLCQKLRKRSPWIHQTGS